jgi:hypothetical protein
MRRKLATKTILGRIDGILFSSFVTQAPWEKIRDEEKPVACSLQV